jgi:plasmid stabilization system protein ParE
MRYEVRLTPLAEEDLEEAYLWLEERSPQSAAAMAAAFERSLTKLERFPLRCASIPENRRLHTGYRQLWIRLYRMVFRVEGRRVLVLRFVHGARKAALPKA